MRRRMIELTVLLLAAQAAFADPAAHSPAAPIDRPAIADNQQFGYACGATDNKGLCKNTYQFSYHVKVAATGLIFPLSQTYSSWSASENQTEFTNPATYRAAISINKGVWTQLTWGGAKTKECAFHEMIVNDPVMSAVKPGDTVYVRTEITVPPGGKWGYNLQAREGGDKNWSQGGTNTTDDVLLSDTADFSPQMGIYIHSALGMFGTPATTTGLHPSALVGDSIAGYVFDPALAVGNSAPIINLAMSGESAGRFLAAGKIRQTLFGGCDTLLFQDGVNDMREGKTFAQLKDSATTIWDAFRRAGGKHLIVFTITPLSTSTDKWATETGQTAAFAPDQRKLWNDYVRHLTAKDVKMSVTVIDTAAIFESAPNNSLWKPAPKGASTDDGIHPNAVGGAYLAEHVNQQIKDAIAAGP